MLRRLGHWLIVCALVFGIGAHWAILQSVAWVGMTVAYSHNSTFKEALSKTFGGLYPCKLCKVVQEGKKSEKREQAQKPIDKLELFCVLESVAVKAPAVLPPSTDVVGARSALGEAPPKPPPRQIPG